MGRNNRREEALLLTGAVAQTAAEREGPKKKSWNEKDLVPLKARNTRQAEAIQAFEHGDHLALFGSAGTGKTWLAVRLAMALYCRGEVGQIVIARSAVPGRDLGALKGSLDEKLDPYKAVYRDLFDEIIPRYSNNFNNMIDAGVLLYESTSFLRGRTLRNCAIVLDEVQNFNEQEVETAMTRPDEGRLIITGDTKQIDLNERHERSGLRELLKTIPLMPSLTHVQFKPEDMVRRGIAREYLQARERLDALEAARLEATRAQANPIPQPQPLARAAA